MYGFVITLFDSKVYESDYIYDTEESAKKEAEKQMNLMSESAQDDGFGFESANYTYTIQSRQ